MKVSFILFFLAFRFVPGAFGQQALLERAIDFEPLTEVHQFFMLPNGDWILGGNGHLQEILDLPFLLRTNDLFEQTDLTDVTRINTTFAGVAAGPNGSVVWGQADNIACDFGWPGVYARLDGNLDTIWTQNFSTGGRPLPLSDSLCAFYDEGGVTLVYWSGVYAGVTDTYYESTSALGNKGGIALGPYDFLIYGPGIVTYKYDSLDLVWGSEIFQDNFLYPAVVFPDMEKFGSNGFAAITSNRLFRMNQALAMTDTLDLSGDFSTATHLETGSNRIFIGGTDANNLSKICCYDSAFNLLWSTVLSYPFLEVSGMELEAGKLFVMMEEQYGMMRRSVVKEFEVNSGQSTDYGTDAAVTELWVADQVNGFPMQLRFSAIVENAGTDTLTSFHLNFKKQTGWNCIENFYYQSFEGVSLAPGESDTFDLGWTQVDYHGTTFNRTICIFSSTPNHHFDRDPSNDSACVSVLAVRAEVPLETDFIEVFPNPTSGNIFLNVPENWKPGEWTVEFCFADGRKSMAFEISPGMEFKLPENFANGLFYYQLMHNSQPVKSGKIILVK